MGNCQAAEAATVVIQHRDGRLEKAYRSLPATQVMAANPGHYVAIVITTPRPRSSDHRSSPTRYLKLLRPDDALLIGNVYRLVTFEGRSRRRLLPVVVPSVDLKPSKFLAEVLREFASKKQVRLSRLLIKRKEIRSRPRKGSGAEHYDNGGRVAEAENSPAAKVTKQPPLGPEKAVLFMGTRKRLVTKRTAMASTSPFNPLFDSREEHDQVEAQLDTELEEAVRGMMSTGARAAGARHRQWKPALHSIAEVATVSSAALAGEILGTEAELEVLASEDALLGVLEVVTYPPLDEALHPALPHLPFHQPQRLLQVPVPHHHPNAPRPHPPTETASERTTRQLRLRARPEERQGRGELPDHAIHDRRRQLHRKIHFRSVKTQEEVATGGEYKTNGAQAVLPANRGGGGEGTVSQPQNSVTRGYH
ncbi:hypothetical protein MUK42_33031 [Musa troglodytarum]|uniref:DUF4228 domain protein n=1 Tax=Musa troglodytarum TaxID=320322 RepID=A0A9E7L4B1_9LILI|nr:hypothetical protein MUK42_33031 [Musa troglodytarum]